MRAQSTLIINLSLPALLFLAWPMVLNRPQCSREVIFKSASHPLPPPYLPPLSAPHWLGIYLNMRRPACCFWQRGLKAETLSPPLPPPSFTPPNFFHPSIPKPPAPCVLPQPPWLIHFSPASAVFVNLNHRALVKRHYRRGHCACVWVCVCLSACMHIMLCILTTFQL